MGSNPKQEISMGEFGNIDTRPFAITDPAEPGRRVQGRVHLPEGTEEAGAQLPYVLVLHGFKGFMDWGFFPEITRRLVQRGIATVPFNFSGSGVADDPFEITDDEAFARNTPSRAVEDVGRVRAMIEHAGVPGLEANRAGILGHSFGGAVTFLHAARRHDYRAVVAWAPVGDFVRRLGDVEAWRAQGYQEIPNARTGQIHRLGVSWVDDVLNNQEPLDVRGACERLTTPTLICHGSEDGAVPIDEGEMLRDAFGEGICRFMRLEGTGHTFGGTHPLGEVGPDLEQVLEATVETFARQLL